MIIRLLPVSKRLAQAFDRSIMESYTPRSFISGYLPAVRGNAREAVSHAAASLLGVDQVAIVYTSANGSFWYLAAPAADLASHPGATTALAAALPGNPQHEGEGAYTLDLNGGLQAVVVRQNDRLHCYVGTSAMVNRFIALENAKAVHPCTDAGQAWEFSAALSSLRNFRLSLGLTISGIIVASIASAAWLWASFAERDLDEARARFEQQNKTLFQAALGRDRTSYPKALEHLQRAIEQAIKEKGVLQQFEDKDGHASWTLKVDQRTVAGSAN